MSSIFTDQRFGWHSAKVKLPEGFNAESTPMFNLDVPISHNWDSKRKKLLIIAEHVDSHDLRNGALCSEFYGGLLSSLLKQAIDYANLVADAGSVKDYGLAVVNFQSFKHYHLDSRRQTIAERAMAARVERMMAMLQPTHILVLGDTAARHVLKEEHYRETRGWVRRYKRDWGSFVAMSTIDPADLIVSGSNLDAALDGEDDDDDEGDRDLYAKTNLLGQAYRDMSHIFTYGKVEDPHGLPFSIHGAEYKHHLITSMSKVEKVIERCMAADHISVDTEAANLNRIANKLLTIQLSTDAYRSFVIPFRHRQSPFSEKQCRQIRDMMYELLCNPNVDPFGTDRYLVGTNLQFDMTILRQHLQIPLVTWPLFDIQNADFILDENLSELDAYAGNTPKAWSLAAIATRYGSVAYLEKEGFNKADRANMEACDLEDETVIEYMGLD
jgi:uracil-DNA glycosylase